MQFCETEHNIVNTKTKLKIYSRPKDIVKTSYSNGVIQASSYLHNEDTTLLRLRYLIVAIVSANEFQYVIVLEMNEYL